MFKKFQIYLINNKSPSISLSGYPATDERLGFKYSKFEDFIFIIQHAVNVSLDLNKGHVTI